MPAFSGAALRAQREALHLTREALAVGLGRTASSLHKYETGAVLPPTLVVGDLAALLGCPVDALFAACADDERLARVRAALTGVGT